MGVLTVGHAPSPRMRSPACERANNTRDRPRPFHTATGLRLAMHAARPRSPAAKMMLPLAARSSSDDDRGVELSAPGRASPPRERTSFDIERAALLPPDGGAPGGGGAPKGEEPVDWVMTALLFLFPAVGGLLFGYDIGATSGALVSMLDPVLSGTDWYALTPFTSGLVVSLSLGGALAGSALALGYGDRLGRRRELLLASALYASGALTVALAPGLPVVLAGRFLYGLGIGFAMHAAPAYIAETSPAKVRGLLISLKEAFIVGGILGGYAVSSLAIAEVGGWRSMYGVAAPAAAVLAAGMAWLPESPRWLLLSGGGQGAAAAALRRLKGSAAVEAEVEAEVEDIAAAMQASPRGGAQQSASFDLTEVLRPQYRRPLAVGMSLMLFQQITGQPSVLYYAAKIFQEAGFSGPGEATRISVVLGLFKLLMTGVAVATVDSWGRRPLLLWGVGGIVAALLALGAAGSGVLPIPEGAAAWTNLVALLVYVGAYQMSFGPISWLLVGEVFPLRVRGQAIALATLTNFGSNFGVSLVLPSIQEAYGPAATYFVFAAIGVGALVTINAIVPETKGKSLEEIERMWGEADAAAAGTAGGTDHVE